MHKIKKMFGLLSLSLASFAVTALAASEVCPAGSEWVYDCNANTTICGGAVPDDELSGVCVGVSYTETWQFGCTNKNNGNSKTFGVPAGQLPSYQDIKDNNCKLGEDSGITDPANTFICNTEENGFEHNDKDWAQALECSNNPNATAAPTDPPTDPPTSSAPTAAPTFPPAPACNQGNETNHEWEFDCDSALCGNSATGSGACTGIDYDSDYEVKCKNSNNNVKTFTVGAGQAPAYQDFMDNGCKLGKSTTITSPETTYICSPVEQNQYGFNDQEWAEVTACADQTTVRIAQGLFRSFVHTPHIIGAPMIFK